jgi:hypothetical protein
MRGSRLVTLITCVALAACAAQPSADSFKRVEHRVSVVSGTPAEVWLRDGQLNGTNRGVVRVGY